MSEHEHSDGAATSRRGLLRSLAVAGAAAVAAGFLPRPAAAKSKTTKKKLVEIFRLSSNDQVSCHACRNHHRYHFFQTAALANGHRAHPGCNCKIKSQLVTRKTARKLFGPKGLAQNGIVDLRQTAVGGLKKKKKKKKG